MVEKDTENTIFGAPAKYKTAESLQLKIEDYFAKGVAEKEVLVGRGNDKNLITIKIPTITGLVLHCGFADRSSFYDYEKKTDFTYTIKRARTFIENHYEELLQAGNTTGAIFALKNFGWSDNSRPDVDDEVPESGNISYVQDYNATVTLE